MFITAPPFRRGLKPWGRLSVISVVTGLAVTGQNTWKVITISQQEFHSSKHHTLTITDLSISLTLHTHSIRAHPTPTFDSVYTEAYRSQTSKSKCIYSISRIPILEFKFPHALGRFLVSIILLLLAFCLQRLGRFMSSRLESSIK